MLYANLLTSLALKAIVITMLLINSSFVLAIRHLTLQRTLEEIFKFGIFSSHFHNILLNMSYFLFEVS